MSTKERSSTVSIPRKERVIEGKHHEALSFEYRYFCKNIMKKAVNKVSACFLTPLKWYHGNRDKMPKDIIRTLEKVMDNFSKMPNSQCEFFWIWLDCEMQYGRQCLENDWEKDIKSRYPEVIEDAKSQLGDAPKLKGKKYIENMCSDRGEIECLILNIYEMTLKKLYDTNAMKPLLREIVSYLSKCQTGINEKADCALNQREEYVFKKAAKIMLLVMRLHLEIDSKLALRWYREGNTGYFYEDDIMLEDYMAVITNYASQSYERFMKMSDMAKNEGNKYAAKEIGDIYRHGAVMIDCHKRRIPIEKNEEKACEFYAICVENKYIPAYMPALKTGVLIDEKQKNDLLEQAVNNGDIEGLIYCAEQYIKKADKHCQIDLKEAIGLLIEAVNTIAVLDNACAEKYVLKNEVLLSETFEAAGKSGTEFEKFVNISKELYGGDILESDRDAVCKLMEVAYLEAGKRGYYEAEYKLGKLFRDIDAEKSEKYFEQGREKGCKWCMLEKAQSLKKRNVKEWVYIMIEIGREAREDENLRESMIKELAGLTDIWDAVEKEEKEIACYKRAELYLLLWDSLEYVDTSGKHFGNRGSDSSNSYNEKDEIWRLQKKLFEGKEKMEQSMFANDKKDKKSGISPQ